MVTVRFFTFYNIGSGRSIFYRTTSFSNNNILVENGVIILTAHGSTGSSKLFSQLQLQYTKTNYSFHRKEPTLIPLSKHRYKA